MRVVVTVTVWLAILIAAATAYVELEGDAAEGRGRERYAYRAVLTWQLDEAAAKRPGVVWVGDSTLIPAAGSTSYPQILRGGAPDTTSMVVGAIGSDFYTYYPVVAALLARHRPGVLVMVAHLRLFQTPRSDPSGSVAVRNDLMSLVPSGDLPSIMRLPLADRGMTVPRLLLARLLRYETMESALYVVDGAKARVAEADVGWLGPRRIAIPMTRVGPSLLGCNAVIYPNQPTVRMMEATVRLARAAGVRVVVVGSPIPWEAMRATIGYDPELYRARFETLRDVVEDAGGVFVDLHDALVHDLFHDNAGHFTPEGANLIAERLRPILAREVWQANRDEWMANHARALAPTDTVPQ